MTGQRDLQFPDVVSFVEELLAKTYRRQLRDVGHIVWCPEWWRHPEAVMRLDAMWMAWETQRGHADGMSTWFRDHADPHMAVLMSPEGPFKACRQQTHKDRLPPLPCVTPAGRRPRVGVRMKPLTAAQETEGLAGTVEAQAATIERLQRTITELTEQIRRN